MREILKDMLETAEYTVACKGNGKTARLDKSQVKKPQT